MCPACLIGLMGTEQPDEPNQIEKWWQGFDKDEIIRAGLLAGIGVALILLNRKKA